MTIRAIKFTRENLPKIVTAYPAVVDKPWIEEELVLAEQAVIDFYFVADTTMMQRYRVMTKHHLEDVYETYADEIGDDFRTI